jgi:MFS superfamily sulfate permease-like transporter
LSERNRCINVLELSRVFAKVQQDRKKTQRHVERERDLEEEQIDKKGQELQCLMQTTFVFFVVDKNEKSIVRFFVHERAGERSQDVVWCLTRALVLDTPDRRRVGEVRVVPRHNRIYPSGTCR